MIFVKSKYPDEVTLAGELQNLYPEYKRKKLNILKVQIRQCLDEIGDEDSDLELNNNAEFEMKASNGEEPKFFIDKKPSNMFNNSINELYKRTSALNQSSNATNTTPDAINLSTNQTTNQTNNQSMNITLNNSKFINNTIDSSANLLNADDSTFNRSTSEQSGAKRLVKGKLSTKKRSLEEEGEQKVDKLLLKQLKMKNKYVKEPKVNFSDFAGIDDKIAELKRFVNHFKTKQSFYPKDYRSLLVHGPSGVGKSSLVEATANYLSTCLLSTVLNSTGNNEQVFNDLLELVRLNESEDGCLILLDRIDSIGLKTEGSNLEKDRNIIVQLENFLDSLPEFNEKRVLLVATTNKYEKLDAEIQNLFDINLKLDLPNQQARHQILSLIREKHLPNLQLDVGQLSKQTPGYVAKDYHNLFITAKHIANERYLTDDQPMEEDGATLGPSVGAIGDVSERSGITIGDVEEALKLVSPASKNEGFANMSTVSWDDIGALVEAKDLLKLCILDRVKYKEIAEAFKLNKPVGILMYGPPGCGKTLLAKAIANEAEINFISVRGPELMNKYVGESERAVRELFQRANKLKPCLIFFDEFDSISSCKTDTSNDVTTRVMKQLLVEMDGYDSRSCFMLAATNRPDLIDPAILRPGRFNKAIYIGVPNAEERVDILKTITKNGTHPKCSSTVDFDRIGSAPSLDGYSGADLTELIDIATESAFKRFISRKESGELLGQNEAVVQEEDFDAALRRIRPPLSEKQRRRYEEMKIKFESMQK